MTKTEKLKEYIEENNKSLREFAIKIDMPYTTIHSIFRRGIENSSVSNVAKICDGLNISLSDLLQGEIKPCYISTTPKNERVLESIEKLLYYKSKLSNGNKLDTNEIKNILKITEFLVTPDA